MARVVWLLPRRFSDCHDVLAIATTFELLPRHFSYSHDALAIAMTSWTWLPLHSSRVREAAYLAALWVAPAGTLAGPRSLPAARVLLLVLFCGNVGLATTTTTPALATATATTATATYI